MEDSLVISSILQRLNHIESVLVTSLFGILVTSTLATFGGILQLIDKEKENASYKHPVLILAGINVLFFFLSGYYYYMLTHFYSSASILVEASREFGLDKKINLDYLWSYFTISGIPISEHGNARNIFYLALAPLFPLLLTLSVTGGLFLILLKKIRLNAFKIVLLLFFPLVHCFICYSMTKVPFTRFLDVVLR